MHHGSRARAHCTHSQEQVLGESLAMIQDSQERFGRAVEDLQMFLVRSQRPWPLRRTADVAGVLRGQEENEEELAAGDASELFGEAKAFVGRCGSAE